MSQFGHSGGKAPVGGPYCLYSGSSAVPNSTMACVMCNRTHTSSFQIHRHVCDSPGLILMTEYNRNINRKTCETRSRSKVKTPGKERTAIGKTFHTPQRTRRRIVIPAVPTKSSFPF